MFLRHHLCHRCFNAVSLPICPSLFPFSAVSLLDLFFLSLHKPCTQMQRRHLSNHSTYRLHRLGTLFLWMHLRLWRTYLEHNRSIKKTTQHPWLSNTCRLPSPYTLKPPRLHSTCRLRSPCTRTPREHPWKVSTCRLRIHCT